MVEILADAGYQGLGAQTGGRVVTPPHRKFKKNAPDWYEERYERQRKAHSSRRTRVEHGITHLKNWRFLTRHLGRREHMSDTVQACVSALRSGSYGTKTPNSGHPVGRQELGCIRGPIEGGGQPWASSRRHS
ncbi:transposase family protein [Streptomyces sp. NPDC058548]|uniref:transposase family protein n=1 Tax=Streptomyces sp. NPDC058548 TaxID=3346545 RepID=UPI003661C460